MLDIYDAKTPMYIGTIDLMTMSLEHVKELIGDGSGYVMVNDEGSYLEAAIVAEEVAVNIISLDVVALKKLAAIPYFSDILNIHLSQDIDAAHDQLGDRDKIWVTIVGGALDEVWAPKWANFLQVEVIDYDAISDEDEAIIEEREAAFNKVKDMLERLAIG